jgi:SAM-dependent methyltransferase
MAQEDTIGLKEICSYWSTAANAIVDKDMLLPTARDPHLQHVVEDLMLKWIYPTARVFDFGCGEGSSSIKFAKVAKEVVGFDYIGRFVEAATSNASRGGLDNISFYQSDVLDLSRISSQHGQADIAITIRCLINLAHWENQAKALRNIHDVLKPGGLYLLSEGWLEGWDGLNRARHRAGLEPIELVKYNHLISRAQLEKYVRGMFKIEAYLNAGFYIFMSRVFQPCFVAPNKPAHTHQINRIASELLSMGLGHSEFSELDYAGVYVLRKL